MQTTVTADLKPMELGEILDAAITIFRRHFGLFLKIGVVALWFPVALTIYIQLAGGPQQHILLAILAWLTQWFAGLFLTASTIRVISDSYLGRPPVLGDAVAMGAAKMWGLFVVGLGKGIILGLIGVLLAAAIALANLGVTGGAAFAVTGVLVIGCIWLLLFVACGYAVTTPVVVLEHLAGSFDAFGRSWELTRGLKRKVLGIFTVTFLMVYLPVIIFGAIGGWLSLESPAVGEVVEVLSAALPIVLTPLLSCVLTLVYYDLRVRREAFDLQILSQQLGLT
ncbi:MAG: hypothetical protein ACREMN_11185 [Gemmatimonadales bacterium]